MPDVGTAWANASAPAPLQLEDDVSNGGRDLVELLLPAVSGLDSKSTGSRVLAASVAPFGLQAVGGLGWSKDSSQSIGLEFRSSTERALMVGVSPGLRSGTESGRVSLVPLEATRTAKLLPAELPAIEPVPRRNVIRRKGRDSLSPKREL
jgi:hypothetical protein